MKTILEYLQATDYDFIAPCNGQKKCGKCKVKIIDRVASITAADVNFLTKKELAMGYRLACCHRYYQGDNFELPRQEGIIEDNLYLEDNSLINVPVDSYGFIIDIGTTTVAIKKVDLFNGEIICSEAFFNPQGKFGSDVIARIEFDNQDSQTYLGDLIIKVIFNHLVIDNQVKEIIVCGNATMLNLFLKKKVRSIGVSPFNVPIIDMTRKPINYFINNRNKVDVITINHISAYVGSDIVMGIYATNMDQKENNSLLMDLGTNGEIAVGNREGLLVTSCPAGPAFEGVNIECGGPSIVGAICNTIIENGKIIYQTIDNQTATCICGSGLISLIANLLRLKIIDTYGNFNDHQKKYSLSDNVYLSVKDIKAFMLAKAAIQAGKEVLLEGLQSEVETIYLAGGFGSYLQKEDLVTLSIISINEAKKLKYINNSALSGTYKLLLSREFKRVQEISNLAKVVYLEKDPNFNDYWIDAMGFE